MKNIIFSKLRLRLATYLNEVEAGEVITVVRSDPNTRKERKAAVILSHEEYLRLKSLEKK